ncbi:MAG: NAD(P)/FAD-dependent oxidoreductase [Candidatus Tyrphobacter sp.]
MQVYAIAGGGLAAVSAVEALRRVGFEGRIVLIGDESESPYQRPPLSKDFLRGETSAQTLPLRSAEFYRLANVELLLGDVVTSVSPQMRRLKCASGTEIAYDKLLLATGGTPRRLHVPGADLPGIRYLRTVADATELRAQFERHPSVLVIGGGFIGCEVAASARLLGCDVTVVSPSAPMAHALGDEVGAIVAQRHRSRGVTLVTGTVTEFRGTTALEAVALSDGRVLECSLAVVGIGIVPNLSMVPELDTRDGIVTDEFCRTQIPDVFAAGDVAKAWRPRLARHARLEHFDNAELQGAAAGAAMGGKGEPYDPIPFFWSDQYDFELQYYGSPATWDATIVRGAPPEQFAAFYIAGGRIEGICLVNRSRDANAAKRLLGRTNLAPRDLADDGVSFAALVRGEAAPQP